MESGTLVETRLRETFGRTRAIVADLTDDEFFWEPVPRCWSVRRRTDIERGWGLGEWQCEDAWPAPEPLPVTTIAWRVVHLAAWTDIYRSFAFEDGTASLLRMDVPGTASAALGWLERAQEQFLDAVGALRPGWTDERRPAHWGEEAPLPVLVEIIDVEHTHHGAEISLLRDLRRGHARKTALSR